MANEQHSSQGRRPHPHRSRRGADRRGLERRTPPRAQEPQGHRDRVDVDQIMRDIRTQIARRHGIDLTAAQIQELAARRLEAIFDPQHVKPALLEQLRRASGTPIDVPLPAAPAPGAPLEEAALYRSDNGLLHTLRRWLHPLLKLFIDPRPLVDALNAQAGRHSAVAAREAAIQAQQVEWNALHYTIVQRLVTEIARTTIENQRLAMQVESLSAKVDFNERRVMGIENAAHQARPAHRASEPAPVRSRIEPPSGETPEASTGPADTRETKDAGEGTAEGTRRRRRRRRGRRSSSLEPGASSSTLATGVTGEAPEQGAEPFTGDLDTEDEGDGDADLLPDDPEPPVDVQAGGLPVEPPPDVPVAPPVTVPDADRWTPEPVDALPPESDAASPAVAPAPVQPAPPGDEPTPDAPVDRAEPGPPER